jgi:hypothetical protein
MDIFQSITILVDKAMAKCALCTTIQVDYNQKDFWSLPRKRVSEASGLQNNFHRL